MKNLCRVHICRGTRSTYQIVPGICSKLVTHCASKDETPLFLTLVSKKVVGVFNATFFNTVITDDWRGYINKSHQMCFVYCHSLFLEKSMFCLYTSEIRLGQQY